jgi:hypothetical protein
LLYKSLEFKNVVGQKVKVIEIPVIGIENRYYFMIQTRLQTFTSSLYNKPQEKGCYSFREYLKRKMKWPDFKDLYSMEEFKNNA